MDGMYVCTTVVVLNYTIPSRCTRNVWGGCIYAALIYVVVATALTDTYSVYDTQRQRRSAKPNLATPSLA